MIIRGDEFRESPIFGIVGVGLAVLVLARSGSFDKGPAEALLDARKTDGVSPAV